MQNGHEEARVLLTVGPLTEPLTGRHWTPPVVTREVSARAARYCRDGLHPGDRVLLHFGNRLEFFAELLAIWRSGAVAVPLDPTLTRVELERLVETVAPRFSVVDDGTDGVIARALPPRVTVVDATQPLSPADLPADAARPECDALMLFTSGSTGDAQGRRPHAPLAGRPVVRLARRARPRGAIAARCACCRRTSATGSSATASSPGSAARTCTSRRRSGPICVIAAGHDDRRAPHHVPVVGAADVEARAPKMASRRAAERSSACTAARPRCPRRRGRDIRGGPARREVCNTYGITETGSWVAGLGTADVRPRGRPHRRRHGARSCTCSAPTRRRPCAAGEVGDVWIDTPALMRGYLEQRRPHRRAIAERLVRYRRPRRSSTSAAGSTCAGASATRSTRAG